MGRIRRFNFADKVVCRPKGPKVLLYGFFVGTRCDIIALKREGDSGDPRRPEAVRGLVLYTTRKFIKNSMLRRSAHSPETVKRTSKQKTQVLRKC